MHDDDGFSLLEPLIFIVILRILAGVAASALGNTTDADALGGTVANALPASGNMPRAQLSRLDGTQRSPSNSTGGWTYDFNAHTTSDASC